MTLGGLAAVAVVLVRVVGLALQHRHGTLSESGDCRDHFAAHDFDGGDLLLADDPARQRCVPMPASPRSWPTSSPTFEPSGPTSKKNGTVFSIAP
jgi:hypothetical protein